MGKNKYKERQKLSKLPPEALTVAQYAKKWPCNTSYIYKLEKEKKNFSFEIVDFHGINFVIPK